ncbi:MAG: leucine-rich repeat protein [Ruminococcus sp.]|nr:leucine-rich repeat protein [Ruminococcus sp.]
MKKNRIIAVGMAFALSFTALQTNFLPTVLHNSFTSCAYEEITYNGMTFIVGDQELLLTSYSGTDSHIEVPEKIDGYTVTEIGNYAFRDNTQLKSIKLPDTINDIGTSAFQNTGLVSFDVPENVTSIHTNTFADCINLEKINLSDNVSYMYLSAFANTKVDPCSLVKEDMTFSYNGILYEAMNGEISVLSIDTSEKKLIKDNVVIPDNFNGFPVTRIIKEAFNRYSNDIKSFTLPDSIYDIGESAFFGITTLESINIPKNVSVIQKETFRKCSNLSDVKFHDDIEIIDITAFEETKVTIPDNLISKIYDDPANKVVNVSKDIFGSEDNYVITDSTVELNLSVNRILNYALTGFDNLKTINLKPINLKLSEELEINTSAFSYCPALESINFSPEYSKVTIRGERIIDRTSVSNIQINSPCDIMMNAFSKCETLESVSLKKDAKVLRNAFTDCKNLTELELGGVSDISLSSFSGCPIQNLIISENTEILSRGLNNCTELMNINGEPAFDSKTGDFNAKYKDFIFKSFYNAEEIGFINEYVQANVKRIVSENTDSSMSEIEKVKILHDWVCDNTVYDPDEEKVYAPENRNDASVLMNGKSVCVGYAKMCNLLFNEAGIETYFIESPSHAWNIVKIGGHYFHVDSTWDDGDSISYNFFMKSDDEIADDTHINYSAEKPSSLHYFQKDGMPECSYSMGDCNMDGKISIADLVRMNQYILNKQKINADDAILYDLDFSGKIDVFDVIKMRQIVVNQ